MKRILWLLLFGALALPAFAGTPVNKTSAGELAYTVQPGDTLWEIAEQQLDNPGAWKRLQVINKVADPNVLTPGTVLRIPYSLGAPNLAVAEALLVRGKVIVRHSKGGPAEPLKSGAQVRVGSTVETGPDGMVTLRFADRSRMLVSPNSRLTLSSLSFNRKSGVAAMRATLGAGRVENEVSPQRGVKARYEIRTPSLNLAVRGTRFLVQLDGKTGITRSSVTKGVVAAGNRHGEVKLAAGFGTLASLDKGPIAPRALLPAPQLDHAAGQVDFFPVRFPWKPLAGAGEYRVELLAHGSGDELVQSVVTQDHLSQWTTLPDGDYRLRVHGIDKDGLEGRNGTLDFKVRAWPAAPLVSAPLDGAVVSGKKIHFRWARNTDADYLHFQVARDADFHHVVMQIGRLTALSSGLKVALKPGHYFWRVAAGKRGKGNGPFGPVQGFEVAASGGGGKTAPRMLRWRRGKPGERYRIQVAANDSFANPLIDAEQSATELTLPKSGKVLYVRLKRITSDGFPGAFESTQYIKLQER